MTKDRFQAALDKITGSIIIPQELMAHGIYQQTIDALTLAARHAEIEAAAEEMATSLWAIRNFDGRRNRRHFNGLIDEALARWRKSREAGG